MDRGAWRATVHGVTKSRTDKRFTAHALTWCIMAYQRRQNDNELDKKSKFRVKEGGLATAFEKWETRSFRSEEFS